MALLEVSGLTKQFGGLKALNAIDLAVEANKIIGIIGPNGAGKTTFFNSIAGYHKPTEGKVLFNGQDITGWKTNRIARQGMVRTFQLVHLLLAETVFENVRIAHYLQRQTSPVASIMGTTASRECDTKINRKTSQLLERMGLEHLSQTMAGSLPHGMQRLCGICMVMAATPKMLLLDEPAAGMSPAETQAISKEILNIRNQGHTIVLVEHDMNVIMSICDRIAVLNFGMKIAEGTPEEVSRNEEVISAYLGSSKKEN